MEKFSCWGGDSSCNRRLVSTFPMNGMFYSWQFESVIKYLKASWSLHIHLAQYWGRRRGERGKKGISYIYSAYNIFYAFMLFYCIDFRRQTQRAARQRKCCDSSTRQGHIFICFHSSSISEQLQRTGISLVVSFDYSVSGSTLKPSAIVNRSILFIHDIKREDFRLCKKPQHSSNCM